MVSTGKDPHSPNKLILNLETFYAAGEVGSEAALNAALVKEDIIVLANNIELSDCFVINDGKAHTLDLNGYTLSRTLSEKSDNGNVIRVNSKSKLTIRDSSSDSSGMISGGNAHEGGGAYIEGEMVVEGGGFSQNTADLGGGLYASGSVTIGQKAVIEENTAHSGGGIYIAESGTVTMSGGKIEGNKSPESGGGVYNLGTLELTETAVISNTADHSGAGVWSSGQAALKKAEITRNTNAVQGGGV